MSARDVALCAAVALAMIFAHHDALAAMVRLWNVSPMYSYGFTVPLISAYLVWTRRAALARLKPEPSWLAGVALVVLAVTMAAAARAGGIQLLDQLAFVVSLTAGVLLLFGGAYARVAWAALAYLLLMIPIWDGFTEPLHEPFQLRSAAIGVWVLQTVGIPAFRDGTMIALPGVKLEVARACSGVNYLIAVMALGLPLAYLYLEGIWRRVVLLVSALVVAALSNGLRVALIGTLAHLELGSPLHGPIHVLHGLFVAGIGYVVLFAGLRLLAREAPAVPVRSTSGNDGADGAERPPVSGRVISARAALLLAAVFIGVGFNAFWRGSKQFDLEHELRALPTTLGNWVSEGDLAPVNAASLPWRSADSELRRRYRRADGAVVDLYVAYFASQRQDKEMINSRSTSMQRSATLVRLPGESGRVLEVNYAAAAGDAPATMFWYQLDQVPEANPYVVKAKTLWNAILRGRSSGAVVVLGATEQGRSEGRALGEFAPLVSRALADHLSGNSGKAGT